MIKRIIKERKHKINGEVRYEKVRLITETGSSIMSSFEASVIAKNSGLDLILINDKSDPPVVKIEEYSKFLYNIEKQEKINKKKQKSSELKEIQLSPEIAENDILTKSSKAIEFLEKGNKVKILVALKGRQKAHPERGELIILKFISILEQHGEPESFPKFENFRYVVILKPKKK